MTTNQIAFIIDRYNNQPIAADKLGGTLELVEMTLAYNRFYNERVTEGEILNKLIGLRKDGKLPKKTDRGVKSKPKPTFGRTKNGKLTVKVELEIEFHSVCSIIDDMLTTGERMPVTRQEVYDYLISHPDSVNAKGYWQDELTEPEMAKIQETVFRLFPDLV